MCGIAGFVTWEHASGGAWIPSERKTGAEARTSTLERMTSVLTHRGPDGVGYYSDGTAHLGHRRLSIIDLAAGAQPMTNEDHRIWITYNGEIFNHASLRERLQGAGHHYQTRSDTESILHAYEQYGSDCVQHFRGMFSFALWDSAAGELFCARDRMGIKPFYYYADHSRFVFASEIKALLEHPAVSAVLDETQAAEYLAFGYSSGDRTLYRGIRKLLPGHTLRLRVRDPLPQPRTELYWDVPQSDGAASRSDREWIEECRERLEEAVRTRLMSDVPLGMFLSGGVDSSALAALMMRTFSGRVKTFAVGYPEESYSELAYARQVATSLGTEHHEVVLGMEDFFAALPKLIWHEDEPIAWPSSVSLYFVSRLASEQVKVVLTGEGSDELFAGYGRYRTYRANLQALRFYRLLPPAVRKGTRTWIAGSPLLSASLRRKFRHTMFGRAEDLESLYLDNFYCAFSRTELDRIGAPAGSPYETYLGYWNARPDQSSLTRALYADQKTYLVELLMKQDQMSMAASIESRVPFLDHPFVEFAARVPDRLKIHAGTGKYILKQAVSDLLPASIVHRKKMGFPTPLAAWFRDDRAEPLWDALRARDGLLASLVDLEAVDSLIERHRRGFEDATDRLWRLLNFQIWGDVFLLDRAGRWEAALAGPISAR